MFNLMQNENEIIAPCMGKVLDLSEVPEEIFASRLAGDGVAVDCTNNTIVAPADGKISLTFKTNHAFSMTLDNGVDILVHIGIDTVELEGKGFKRLVEEGEFVRVGEPIIIIDKEFIEAQGYSLITPVLIINMDEVKDIQYKTGFNAISGKDTLFTYKIR